MSKEDFKAQLVTQLLDDMVIQKNEGTEENPKYTLDIDNLKNYELLIQRLANFAFSGE